MPKKKIKPSTIALAGSISLSAVALVLSILAMSCDKGAVSASSTDAGEIKRIVEQSIMDDPGMIERAFMAKQEEEQRAQQLAVKDKVKDYMKDLQNKKGDPVLGNPRGDVTIVKFYDYQCGYCKRLSGTFDELLKEDENVRLVLKPYPVMGGTLPAKAALAANAQGKLKAYHELLLKESDYSEASLMKLARQANLDTKKMKAYMDKEAQAQIDANMDLASKLGAPGGIPFSFVEETLIHGALPKEQFKAAISDVRAMKRARN